MFQLAVSADKSLNLGHDACPMVMMHPDRTEIAHNFEMLELSSS